MYRLFCTFLVMLLLPLACFAVKTQEFRLQNGLKLIVRVDKRAPVVLFSTWYKVGGSYEQNGITGVSHLLEHLMFKGTEKYGPGIFNEKIANLGGVQNAMTSLDYTMYYQILSSNHLATSLELEADRMRNLLLKPSQFVTEKKVVMEERRMRIDDNPQGLLWERFNAAAFINSPYHHPVVGWMTDLQHMTLKDAQDWYTEWYAPNNAIIVVVGNVDPDHVYALTQRYFGILKPSHLKVLKPRTEERSVGERKVVVNVPAKLPMLLLGYNAPSLATAKTVADKNEVYALRVAAYILGSGQSSLLAKELVRQQALAISTYASYDLFRLHQSIFYIGAVPVKSVSINRLKSAILKKIADLKKSPLPERDLARVKAKLVADRIYKRDSLFRQAMDLGVPEVIGLSWRDSDHYIASINKVTAKEVQAAAIKYLTTNRLTIGELMPQRRNSEKKS